MLTMCLPLLLLLLLLSLLFRLLSLWWLLLLSSLLLILLLLLLLLLLSFLVTTIITIAIFYFCYHGNNNYCYSCHHTDMTSYQNFLYVSVDSHRICSTHQKSFLRDHNGNKATIIPAIAPRIFFYFLFYITGQFLIVNLFGTYLHTNLLTYFLTYLPNMHYIYIYNCIYFNNWPSDSRHYLILF